MPVDTPSASLLQARHGPTPGRPESDGGRGLRKPEGPDVVSEDGVTSLLSTHVPRGVVLDPYPDLTVQRPRQGTPRTSIPERRLDGKERNVEEVKMLLYQVSRLARRRVLRGPVVSTITVFALKKGYSYDK